MTDINPVHVGLNQPRTEGNRDIELIVGEPTKILNRGEDIEDLGQKMLKAAETLSLFGDGSLGSGYSIEALRDDARDLVDDLRIAGKLYQPSGETLVTYAKALEAVQNDTDTLVPNSESKWEVVFETAHELKTAMKSQERYDGQDDPEGDRPSSATEQSAFDTAVSEWEAYWGAYDGPVGRWEAAYTTAKNGLQDANESGPEDGFWDNAMPFVEFLITVLTVIAIIAFVVCFFVTGPLAAVLAAVALVAGIVVVALEASKFLAGRGDWLSLGLSIVGIVPFTKLASLGKVLPKVGTFGAKFKAGAAHLGDDLIKGGQAIKNAGFRTSGFIFSMPFEFGIQGAYHFLIKSPPQLIKGNAARWQNLAGNPTNAVEAVAGSLQGLSGFLGNLDGLLGLTGQGRHSGPSS